jgi:hypothetical protein
MALRNYRPKAENSIAEQRIFSASTSGLILVQGASRRLLSLSTGSSRRVRTRRRHSEKREPQLFRNSDGAKGWVIVMNVMAGSRAAMELH